MTFDEEFRRRQMRRLQQLGTGDPRCGVCGEDDWRCMEQHHVAGRTHDDATVYLCSNCHKKVSDPQRDHPKAPPGSDPVLERIGRFLLGLADLLLLIVWKLIEFGQLLVTQPPALGEASK